MSNAVCNCFKEIDVMAYDGNLDFQPITLDCKELIESYTKPWSAECSDLSFANMFIWGAEDKMQYAVKNDFLFIKLDFKGVPMFLWSPIPKSDCHKDYRIALLIGIKYMENAGVEPTFRSVCQPFYNMIRQSCPEFVAIPTDIAWDYVYQRESLATLKGKKLHSKRNHINKFLSSYPDYVYKKIDNSMIQDCLNLYDLWIEEKKEDVDKELIESLIEERKTVVSALNNMDILNLVGGAIYVDNRLVAFTVGERITDDMQLIHIEKADYTLDGIFPMINQQYILNECSDVEWVNREEDMGIEGMRKAKHSYQPARMIEKYLFGLRDLSDDDTLWGKK